MNHWPMLKDRLNKLVQKRLLYQSLLDKKVHRAKSAHTVQATPLDIIKNPTLVESGQRTRVKKNGTEEDVNYSQESRI